jgi:hypothetical protein
VTWAEYTQAARELAELRRGDAATHADRTALAQSANADLTELTRHLAAQQTHLVNLAKTLRLPEPWFGTVARSPVTNLPEALHRAADAANAADDEARAAEQAGSRPLLLPDLAPTGRNALIYGGCALVGWLFQCALVSFGPETDFGTIAWSLCGLPALAFFAGYLTVSTLGQPRVGKAYPKDVRLGGLICFVGMPLAWIALIAGFALLRG